MEKLSQLLTKGLIAVVRSIKPEDYVRPPKIDFKHQGLGECLNVFEKQLSTIDQLLESEVTELIRTLALSALSDGEKRRLSEKLNVYQNQQAAAKELLAINIKERLPQLWGEVVLSDHDWQIIIVEEELIKELPGMIFMTVSVKHNEHVNGGVDLNQWNEKDQKYVM